MCYKFQYTDEIVLTILVHCPKCHTNTDMSTPGVEQRMHCSVKHWHWIYFLSSHVSDYVVLHVPVGGSERDSTNWILSLSRLVMLYKATEHDTCVLMHDSYLCGYRI